MSVAPLGERAAEWRTEWAPNMIFGHILNRVRNMSARQVLVHILKYLWILFALRVCACTPNRCKLCLEICIVIMPSICFLICMQIIFSRHAAYVFKYDNGSLHAEQSQRIFDLYIY